MNKKVKEIRKINNENFNTEFDFSGAFCGISDIDIVGDLTDDDDSVCLVWVWPQSGYVTHLFAVSAYDLDNALGRLKTYWEKKGWKDYMTKKDYEDNVQRPDEIVFEYLENWIYEKCNDDYTRRVFRGYLYFDPKDYKAFEEYSSDTQEGLLEADKLYKVLDLLESDDMNKRYEAADNLEKIVDYVKECEEYSEGFDNSNIYIEDNTYAVGENFDYKFMSLNEFIKYIKDRQRAA